MAPTESLPSEFTPLLEGLEVVRGKIFFIALWAGVVFMAAYSVSEDTVLWLKDELVPKGASIVLLSPIELILLKIKLASTAAMVAALPPVAYLLWRHARENLDLELDFELGWVGGLLMLLVAGLLFASGVVYSIGFMLPLLLEYLYTDASSAGLEVTYSLGEFLHFTLMLTVALGLGFELPLVIWLMVKGELVSYNQLTQYRRHVFLVFFILAALITPPDVISQLVLAIPMGGLFEVSLLMIRLLDRDAFLADKGQMLDRRTPYAPRAAYLLALYGLIHWVMVSGFMYSLLWYAQDHEIIVLESGWLLGRQELMDRVLFLMATPILATLAFMVLGLKEQLNYQFLTRVRLVVYLASMMVVAWVTPSEVSWSPSYFFLVIPVLVGFEWSTTLFRTAAIYPIPGWVRDPSGEETINDGPGHDEAVDDEPVDDDTLVEETINDGPVDDDAVDDEAVDDEAVDDEPVDDETGLSENRD